MRRWVGKYRYFLLAAGLFVLLYAVSRLTDLTRIPIFTDEAIYIRWSQIGAQDANWRFISLTDGKQPMFTWAMMILLKLIRGDPLYVGRLVSVISGFFSMIGVGVVAYELFRDKRLAFIASGLYLISPFTLMYDRLALYDSMVAMFSIWSLYFSVRLVRTLRLDVAMVLALVLGGGMLNKSSGFLSLYLLPFALLLFDWKKPRRLARLIRFAVLAVVAAVLSEVYYSVLRLSPFFHIIAQKNSIFVYPFREWLTHPFNFLMGNLHGLFDWQITYLTKPVYAAALLPLLAVFHRFREKVYLAVWWFFPFFALAMFGKVLYPRFVLFMSLPLLILAAYTVNWLWDTYGKRYIGAVLIIGIVLPSLYTSYFIVTDPWHALIPASDKGQLLNDWPSGGGVAESVRFLTSRAQDGKIAVYTEGTFGLMPFSLEIYLADNPDITIKSLWPLPRQIPDEIAASAAERPTYLITNQTQSKPDWPLTLLETYQKGTLPGKALRVYKVLPRTGANANDAYL